MNDSIFPSIHPASPPDHPGIYADLAELVRLKFGTRGFSFLPRQPVHSILAGRHASRLRGRGLNFEEIRRYLPGDDIRQMDWRVTARTRKPHVRVYSEERDRPVLLVIDQRQSMFFGSRRAMKSVVAAEVVGAGTVSVSNSANLRYAVLMLLITDGVSVSNCRSSPPYRTKRRSAGANPRRAASAGAFTT